jgi:hypothetical protein
MKNKQKIYVYFYIISQYYYVDRRSQLVSSTTTKILNNFIKINLESNIL